MSVKKLFVWRVFDIVFSLSLMDCFFAKPFALMTGWNCFMLINAYAGTELQYAFFE